MFDFIEQGYLLNFKSDNGSQWARLGNRSYLLNDKDTIIKFGKMRFSSDRLSDRSIVIFHPDVDPKGWLTVPLWSLKEYKFLSE